MALLLLLLSPICFFFCEGADIKIFNGHEVVPHSRPYMVLLKTVKPNSVSRCCGSLIAPDWVLTAAHCNLEPGVTTVILGAHSKNRNEPEKQKIQMMKSYLFKPYDSNTREHDIQLVQLSQTAKLGLAVDTLPLPKKFRDPKKDTLCRVAGWGMTETGATSDKLMETDLKILDRRQCKNLLRREFPLQKEVLLTRDMICTYVGADMKATCKGDSGSPLICNGVFQGVVSYGCRPCGDPGTFDVFTRLSRKYVRWIRKTIHENKKESSSKEKECKSCAVNNDNQSDATIF